MTDKELAEDVRAKAEELNSAIGRAAKAGLNVSIRTDDVTPLGWTHLEHISVHVARIEEL